MTSPVTRQGVCNPTTSIQGYHHSNFVLASPPTAFQLTPLKSYGWPGTILLSMSAIKEILLLACLFGLSLVGIVLGWMDWDRSAWAGHTHISTQTQGLVIVCTSGLVAVLVAVGLALFSDAGPLVASAAGIVAGMGLILFVWLRN